MNITNNMTEFQLKTVLHLIDSEVSMCPLEDLKLAFELIKRNPHLIKDYTSLEDAVLMLKRVIDIETDVQKDREEQLREIYEN